VKPKLYIETSVVSYLTGRPSRDMLVATHQQVTREWWERRRPEFEVFASQLVATEAGGGDEDAAKRRLDVLRDLPYLVLTSEAMSLGREFVRRGPVPAEAADDALHIALATMHGMDYLLTWNCAHIANAEMRYALSEVCLSLGHDLPVICTPEELLGV